MCGTLQMAAIAAAVLVLAAVYVRNRRKKKAGFLGAMIYQPCNVDPLGRGRANCPGYTSGVPPSIDTEEEGGWLCPGLLGVPP